MIGFTVPNIPEIELDPPMQCLRDLLDIHILVYIHIKMIVYLYTMDYLGVYFFDVISTRQFCFKKFSCASKKLRFYFFLRFLDGIRL